MTTPGGDAVAQATVTVRHEGTGFQRVTGTNQDGDFLFLLLQPGGPYTLTVQNLGAREYRQEGIQLQVGETAAFGITLETRAIEIEGLRVEAERTEIFDPRQVGPATLLNEDLVESVPILSRNIMELAILSLLVRTTEGGGLSVAGQNDRYNSEGDMINVLNFLNGEWGRVESVRSVVPMLEPTGRTETIGGPGEIRSRWAGGALVGDDGSLQAAPPWNILSPDSQWQAQFGVRVTFGAQR